MVVAHLAHFHCPFEPTKSSTLRNRRGSPSAVSTTGQNERISRLSIQAGPRRPEPRELQTGWRSAHGMRLQSEVTTWPHLNSPGNHACRAASGVAGRGCMPAPADRAWLTPQILLLHQRRAGLLIRDGLQGVRLDSHAGGIWRTMKVPAEKRHERNRCSIFGNTLEQGKDCRAETPATAKRDLCHSHQATTRPSHPGSRAVQPCY